MFNNNKSRNQYFNFNNYNSDKSMISNLITNAINMHGVCVVYYQTSYDTKYDPIWGEDNNRRYIKKFNIMTYYQLPREDKMWTKFGIENLDNFSMFCSKNHFKVASKIDGGVEVIPKIGDIIMAKYNDRVYEVTEVAEDGNVYLQSKEYIWEFVIKSFKKEDIELPNSLSADTMSSFKNINDIFDISNDIDIEKENVVYKNKINEKGINDPFANWG